MTNKVGASHFRYQFDLFWYIEELFLLPLPVLLALCRIHSCRRLFKCIHCVLQSAVSLCSKASLSCNFLYFTCHVYHVTNRWWAANETFPSYSFRLCLAEFHFYTALWRKKMEYKLFFFNSPQYLLFDGYLMYAFLISIQMYESLRYSCVCFRKSVSVRVPYRKEFMIILLLFNGVYSTYNYLFLNLMQSCCTKRTITKIYT